MTVFEVGVAPNAPGSSTLLARPLANLSIKRCGTLRCSATRSLGCMFALITQEPKARVQSVMSSKIEKGFTAPPSSSLMGRGRRSRLACPTLPSPHTHGTSNRAANWMTSNDGKPASETRSRKDEINAYQTIKQSAIAALAVWSELDSSVPNASPNSWRKRRKSRRE